MTERLAATEGASYEAFYRAHRDDGVRLAHLLTGSPSVAEDLAHDAFAAVLGRFETLDEPARYLRVAIVNACRSWHRQQRRASDRAHLLVAEATTSPVTSDLLDAVDRLPYRYKAVLVLRYWAGLDEREIADAVGCRPGTVKTWSARGLRQLRREIS